MNAGGTGRGGEPEAGEPGGAPPLKGRRIVVTRPLDQAGPLAAALERAGAEVLRAPTIRIGESSAPEPLREAARDVSRYDWVLFTSANAVTRFWAALEEVGLDREALSGVRICAVGPATAATLARNHVRVDAIPAEHRAEALAGAMARVTELRGRRVLYPRAEGAREVAAAGLRSLGAEVDEVVAYRTVPDVEAATGLRNRLARGSVDMITFASGSAVQSFVELVGTELGGACVATIGPVTSARCRELGLPVHLQAVPHTAAGLVERIIHYYSTPGEG